MNVIWENSFFDFFVLTLAIGGSAAFLSGRGLALAWTPFDRVVLYMALLGAGVRFLHYALLDGTLLALTFYIADTTSLILISGLAYRITRTNQMTRQYGWLYRRTSLLSWKRRGS